MENIFKTGKTYQDIDSGIIVLAEEIHKNGEFSGRVVAQPYGKYVLGYLSHIWSQDEFEEVDASGIILKEGNKQMETLLLGGYFNLENNERVSITTVYGLTVYLEPKQMLAWDEDSDDEDDDEEAVSIPVIGEFGGRFVCINKGKAKQDEGLIMYDFVKRLPPKPKMTLEQVKEKLGFDFELIQARDE